MTSARWRLGRTGGRRDRGEGFGTAAVIDPWGNILGLMENPHYYEMLRSMRGWPSVGETAGSATDAEDQS